VVCGDDDRATEARTGRNPGREKATEAAKLARGLAVFPELPDGAERPLLLVVRKPGMEVSETELRELLAGRVAKWWLPDAIEFVDAIPHGATGKISKKDLRDQFREYKLAEA
jgi:fatty-acyl-CoA synthase